MRAGLTLSLLLHAALVGLFLMLSEKPLVEATPVTVQIVLLPQPEPEEAGEAEPEPVPEEVVEAEPEPEPVPEEVVEAEPEPEPVPEEVVEAEPAPEPVPEEVVEATAPEPPQVAEPPPPPEPVAEVAEAQPAPPPVKPDRIVALPPVETQKPKEEIQQAALPQPARETLPEKPPDQVDDLVKIIQAQISPCWKSPPGGVPVVVLRVSLNRNGTIANAALQGSERQRADSTYRQMGNGAQTALTRCGPYRLPSDRYAAWRVLDIEFYAQ